MIKRHDLTSPAKTSDSLNMLSQVDNDWHRYLFKVVVIDKLLHISSHHSSIPLLVHAIFEGGIIYDLNTLRPDTQQCTTGS